MTQSQSERPSEFGARTPPLRATVQCSIPGAGSPSAGSLGLLSLTVALLHKALAHSSKMRYGGLTHCRRAASSQRTVVRWDILRIKSRAETKRFLLAARFAKQLDQRNSTHLLRHSRASRLPALCRTVVLTKAGGVRRGFSCTACLWKSSTWPATELLAQLATQLVTEVVCTAC